MFPVVLAARLAYSAGLVAGGVRWMRYGRWRRRDRAAVGMRPSRDRGDLHPRPARALARALDSLVAQRPAPREIMVVDNAPPDDATRNLVARPLPPGPLLAASRFRGSISRATARSRRRRRRGRVPRRRRRRRLRDGPRRSRGVFEPDPEVARLHRPGGGARPRHTGRACLRGQRRLLPWARLASGCRTTRGSPLHGRPAPLIAWAVSVGQRLQLRRPARRGPRPRAASTRRSISGPSLPGGGDHDLLWRALQAGHAVVYEPAALAWHEHRAGRSRGPRPDRGPSARAARLPDQAPLLDAVASGALAGYLAWRLVKPGVRLVRRAVGRDPLPAPVLARMWWHCWAGLVAYPRARRLARAAPAGRR